MATVGAAAAGDGYREILATQVKASLEPAEHRVLRLKPLLGKIQIANQKRRAGLVGNANGEQLIAHVVQVKRVDGRGGLGKFG